MRLGLGTFVSIEAQATDQQGIEAAFQAAFSTVEEIERLMHPERAGSDLARLTACPPGTPIKVHPWTYEVLALAQHLYVSSGGIFDPCLPGGARLDAVRLAPDCLVNILAPVRLDLGGIAKGFAVDCAVAALQDAGCEWGLVNAGGDLRAFGDRSFDVLCRFGADLTLPLRLRNSALAVSDASLHNAPVEHRGYYRRGEPAVPESGVAALMAPSAALADGLSKWLLLDPAACTDVALHAFGARAVTARTES
jgi:thiamine biosynthesis lipoprotein